MTTTKNNSTPICDKFGCYYTVFTQSNCARNRYKVCSSGEVKLNFKNDPTRRWPMLSIGSIRAEVTIALFEEETDFLHHYFHHKCSFLFHGLCHSNYISVHIRWGDKITHHDSFRLSGVSSYLQAAETMATDLHVGTILVLSSDQDAILQVQHLVNASTNFNYVVPMPNDDAYDAREVFADLKLLSNGLGAIVTFTSNMGRLVRYFRHFDIARDHFKIVSLDNKEFDPAMK